jgi:transcriptional regulator with XRE-family HTH domain
MDLASPVKGIILPGRAVRMDLGFGERLKEAMIRRRVTPGRMARDLKVVPQTVSRWRRGECPDDLRLPELAAYLTVALDWLKSGVGELEPKAPTTGDHTAQRTPSPGRRREDIELRSAAYRHAMGRLDVLLRLIQAYKDAGRPASPDILAEWLAIAALNASDPSPPANPGGGALPPMPPAALSWHTDGHGPP